MDFTTREESEARYQAYSAQRIHDRMQETRAALNIVILDACRDNPFRASRSNVRGWAPMETGRGSFVAFATAPGSTAADNPGESNGLFTKHLLKALDRPSLKLSEVFDLVRQDVDRGESGGKQLPWVASSVVGTFIFRDSSLEERRTAEVKAEVEHLERELAEARRAAERARSDSEKRAAELREKQAGDRLKLEQMERDRLAEEAARRGAIAAEQKRIDEDAARRAAAREHERKDAEAKLTDLRKQRQASTLPA